MFQIVDNIPDSAEIRVVGVGGRRQCLKTYDRKRCYWS